MIKLIEVKNERIFCIAFLQRRNVSLDWRFGENYRKRSGHWFVCATTKWFDKQQKDNDATITDIDIARNDMAKLKEADVLIACLDGLSIDDGVAGEIMAFSVMKDYEEEYKLTDKKRIIIGFVTDMRYLGTGENKLYRNQMIVGQVKDKGYFIVGYPNTDDYKKEIVDIIKREY